MSDFLDRLEADLGYGSEEDPLMSPEGTAQATAPQKSDFLMRLEQALADAENNISSLPQQARREDAPWVPQGVDLGGEMPPEQQAMGEMQVVDDIPWYEKVGGHLMGNMNPAMAMAPLYKYGIEGVKNVRAQSKSFAERYAQDPQFRDQVGADVDSYFDPDAFKDKGFIKKLGRELAAGGVGGARTVEASLYSTLSTVQDLLGDKEDSLFWRKKYETAMGKKAKAAREISKTTDIKTFADAILYGGGAVAEGIPTTLPSTAASAIVNVATRGMGGKVAPWVAGYFAALAPSTVMEVGATSAETYEKVGRYAQGKDFLFGFTAASLDAVGSGRMGGKLGGKAVKEIIDLARKRGKGEVAKRISTEMTKQFFAEGVPEAMQEVIEKIPSRLEANEPLWQQGDSEMMREAFIQGGLTGMVFGGGTQAYKEFTPGSAQAKTQKILEQGVAKWLDSEVQAGTERIMRPGSEVEGAKLGEVAPELESLREELGAKEEDPFDLMDKLKAEGTLERGGTEAKEEIAADMVKSFEEGNLPVAAFATLPKSLQDTILSQVKATQATEQAQKPPSEGQEGALEATEAVEPTVAGEDAQITPEERAWGEVATAGVPEGVDETIAYNEERDRLFEEAGLTEERATEVLDQLSQERVEQAEVEPEVAEEAAPETVITTAGEGPKLSLPKTVEAEPDAAPPSVQEVDTMPEPDEVEYLEGGQLKEVANRLGIKYTGRPKRDVEKDVALALAEGQQTTDEAAIEAGKNLDKHMDESVSPQGLRSVVGGVLPETRQGEPAQRDVAGLEGEGLGIDRPEVAARKKAAHGLSRREEGNAISRAAAWLKKAFNRKYMSLDTRKEIHAQVNDTLRIIDAVPGWSKGMAMNVLKGNVAGLQDKAYSLFEEAVLMPDLLQDIDRGLYTDEDGKLKELPFGYESREEVAQVTERVQSLLESNPKIKEAVERRQAFMDSLRNTLVAENLLDERVLEKDQYFHHQVLEMMADKSQGISKRGLDRKMGWQKARGGSAMDYNTDYLQSEMEVVAQALEQIETKKLVRELKSIADITPELKARAKAEGKALKDIPLPEGYGRWSPKKGNTFYKTLSITEKKLDRMLEEETELTADEFRQVLALGKKHSWVLPNEVIEALNTLEEAKSPEGLGKAVSGLQNTWKQWVLLNPLRILKYNLNNMSGDLDIALAYDPRILKNFGKNAKLLWGYNVRQKSMTGLISEALKYGVIDTGMTTQDIADVSDEGIFKVLSGKTDRNWIRRHWGNSKKFTVWRENILRVTAYEYFLDQIQKGKNPMGASKAHEVLAVKDPKRRAAKLARELVGDYGNLSHGGQWMRRYAIPFYSWIEINAPRYVRLLANVRHEGRGSAGARVAGVASKKAAFGTARFAVKASLLAGLVQIYNRTFFPDEDDELKEDQRHQMHLILGRTSDGRIRTLRFQGALSDALSWFGAEDLPRDIREVREGKATVGGKVEEAAIAPFQKFLDGSVPLLKTPFESLAGKSYWPDFRNPRTVRDRAEHVARMWSVDAIYRAAMRHPTRGGVEETLRAAIYYRDPAEAAYDITRRKVWKWMEVNDVPSYYPEARRGSTAWKKSNALYLYRKSLRYGDERAASKFKADYEKYARKGYEGQNLSESEIKKRMASSLHKSYQRAHPLGSLNKTQRTAFMTSLSDKERETLNRAEEWFTNTYGHMAKPKTPKKSKKKRFKF